MRGIILKDLYEGFCIKKNLINWLASMIFTSALTAISEFMRGAYGFLLIVVLLFPVMGSTLLQMTVEQDEKAEFDRIQLTYPLSKSEIVLSKYLGGLIVQGGMTLYSFVCNYSEPALLKDEIRVTCDRIFDCFVSIVSLFMCRAYVGHDF